jgi:hypothetical protein
MFISRRFHRSIRLVIIAILAVLVPVTAVRAGNSTARPHLLPVPNVQVSRDAFAAHSEPMLAENPTDPKNLVGGSKFFTNTTRYRFKIGTYVSDDGGQKWTDNGLLPGFGAYRTTSDISFAFAPTGNPVYACVLATNGKTSGTFVSRSRDGGHSWSSPVPVFLDRTGATFSDKPWIAVDDTAGRYRGTVYVAWNLDGRGKAGDPDTEASQRRMNNALAHAEPPVGIAVSRSTDYGRTFTPPHIVSPFNRNEFALGAVPVVAPNGTLFVTFLRFHGTGKTTRNDLAMVTSADRGSTFSRVHVMVLRVYRVPNHLPHGTFRNFSLPAFAVSPTSGSLVAAWADVRHGESDILKTTSRDGGRTWSVPSRVNDDPVGDHKDHFQPQLAVSPDGTFLCAWFDRRYDPGNRLIDEVVAASHNDGRTFGPTIRVTTRSWNPAIDAPLPQGKKRNSFIGDYQGLTADGETIHPFWNDTQNGQTQEIRSASVPLNEVVGG